MQQVPYNIVTPARYSSSRFPGKPLHQLNGDPMILHTARRAAESSARLVVVATNDERIDSLCADAGIEVEMTRLDHISGTDKFSEVVARRGWNSEDIVVGLQGDEPATPASHLDKLTTNLEMNPIVDMATLCIRIESPSDYTDSNRVKVVRDNRDMALYFSRAYFPAQRNSLLSSEVLVADTMPDSWLHIGMYAYRCGYLMQ